MRDVGLYPEEHVGQSNRQQKGLGCRVRGMSYVSTQAFNNAHIAKNINDVM